MSKKTKQRQKGGGVYDRTVNWLFNAGLRDGEVHAPVWTANGLKFGRFIGPGSHVIERIKEGSQPISNSDRVAQAHDLRYGNARTTSDVRAADLKMISKLYDLQAKGDEYKVNVWAGALPIRLKMWAEDKGIINKGSFSSMKGWDNADDAKIGADKLAELEQMGYGKKKKNAKPKAKRKPKK